MAVYVNSVFLLLLLLYSWFLSFYFSHHHSLYHCLILFHFFLPFLLPFLQFFLFSIFFSSLSSLFSPPLYLLFCPSLFSPFQIIYSNPFLSFSLSFKAPDTSYSEKLLNFLFDLSDLQIADNYPAIMSWLNNCTDSCNQNHFWANSNVLSDWNFITSFVRVQTVQVKRYKTEMIIFSLLKCA